MSIFLAFMVLFSTFSFTVEKHLCGGEVADYSFIGNVERCDMPSMDIESNSDNSSLKNNHCCNDIIEVIEGTNSELKIVKELDLQKVKFVVAFIYSYVNLFEGLPENIIPFKNHSPPLIFKDFQILFDTFLI